jgi:hypothetical protein
MLIVGVPKCDVRQRVAGFDFQQRQIGLRIAADHLGLELVAIRHCHGNGMGTVHHMIVGHDVAGRIDDEARAQCPLFGRRLGRALPLLAEILAQHVSERSGHVGHPLHLRILVLPLRFIRSGDRGDLHDRRLYLADKLRKARLRIGRTHAKRCGDCMRGAGKRECGAARAEGSAKQKRRNCGAGKAESSAVGSRVHDFVRAFHQEGN